MPRGIALAQGQSVASGARLMLRDGWQVRTSSGQARRERWQRAGAPTTLPAPPQRSL
jgi:hypothetical protein